MTIKILFDINEIAFVYFQELKENSVELFE